MGNGKFAQSRRYMEPAQRLGKSTIRLLLHVQLHCSRCRPTWPRQLQRRKHIPRGVLPVSPQPRATRVRTQHLPHHWHWIRSREPGDTPKPESGRSLLPKRKRFPRLPGALHSHFAASSCHFFGLVLGEPKSNSHGPPLGDSSRRSE